MVEKEIALSLQHATKGRFPLSAFRRRILILGGGSLATGLTEVLLARSSAFTEIVGLLTREVTQVGEEIMGIKVLGTMDQLLEVVERNQVDTIAVCLEDRRSVLPIQSLLDLKGSGIDILDGLHLYEKESGRIPIDELKPSAIIFSTGFRRGFAVTLAKRMFDVLVSVTGLFLTLPVLGIVALAIKLDSPGPVFYRQVRVGLRAQAYMIWKFRSMCIDAEKSGARWTSEQDPRVSRVGRYLRKWRLDEIPQLINVLKGEMSLVGPRPARPVFVQDLRSVIPFYDLRHAVRPGITGWAQTQFRYGASLEDAHVKLQYDLYYVKNLSLRLDLRILLETIRVIMRGEGAR